jgi:hypothetical protein
MSKIKDIIGEIILRTIQIIGFLFIVLLIYFLAIMGG